MKRLPFAQLMDQPVTSVARQPEPYGKAPAAIQVITGEDIRRSGASIIPEALRLADNLIVAQSTSSTWAIGARGFNSAVGNKLLVMIDGRTVYTPLFAGVIWNMQDYLLEDIDRIEVISGPGGTLWGANAVNGVINITTKTAQNTQGWYVEGGGGNSLRDFTALRQGGMLSSNVAYRVYGKFFERGPQVFADGSDAHDSWNRGQGGFRIDTEGLGQNQYTLQGDYFGGQTGTTPGGLGMSAAKGASSGGNVLGRWTHFFTDESNLHLQLYYFRTHLAAPFQSAGAIPSGVLYENLDTYDLDFQHRFPIGPRNRIVWGAGYRLTHDAVRDAPLVAFRPNTLGQNLLSGFVQDEIRLRDDLFLTLGTKLERNDYSGFEFEPSGRLQWNITDRHMAWGAISRAARTPSRYDRDLLQPNPAYGPFLGTLDSHFRSETVIAYELGYRAQITREVSGSVSIFRNEYDNLRSLNFFDGENFPLVFENNLQGHTYGLESSVDWLALDWWRLHLGYTLLKEHLNVRPGRIDLFQGLNETADPQQQGFLRSSMNLPFDLELDTAARWIDTVHNNNGPEPGRVPAYAELDARLAWRPGKNLELSIVGRNLLHDRHKEAGFPGPAQEEIVRSVFGKIAWRY